MKKIFVLIFIILALAAVFVITRLPHNSSESLEKENSKTTQNSEPLSSPPDNSVQNIQNEANDNSATQNSASPAATSGETPSAQIVPDENGCYETKISYSLGNFQTQETCNSLQNNICADKTILCSALVSNLDEQTSGEFTLLFKFTNIETKEILRTTSQTQNVPANTQLKFSETSSFLGQDANYEIKCSIYVVNSPTIKICDVA